MKKKPRLDDVDVVFDPAPLTDEEKKRISEYIRGEKAKQRAKRYTKFRQKQAQDHTAK